MRKLFIFALAGFLVQLADGSLGMEFGASSSSILLTHEIVPAIVSAMVHFSEIATTATSDASYWKFENVHRPTMSKLAIPGSVSGFISATLLTQIHGDYIKPYIVLFLLSMSFYILYQFLSKRHKDFHIHIKAPSSVRLVPWGTVAGFLGVIGGGGWGSINTSSLLASHKIRPRYAIGTVSASEFFVILSTSLSLIVFLGFTQINWWFVIALSIGGMIVAPISAYLTKMLPINILAIYVGGLIIFTNSNTLVTCFIKDTTVINVVRFAVIYAIIVLAIITIIRNKKLSSSYE